MEITQFKVSTEGRVLYLYPPSHSTITIHQSSCQYEVQLFAFHKKQMADKRFAIDTDVKQAATCWPQTFNSNFFYAGIKALVTC
jgi:hypothetical protein